MAKISAYKQCSLSTHFNMSTSTCREELLRCCCPWSNEYFDWVKFPKRFAVHENSQISIDYSVWNDNGFKKSEHLNFW